MPSRIGAEILCLNAGVWKFKEITDWVNLCNDSLLILARFKQ